MNEASVTDGDATYLRAIPGGFSANYYTLLTTTDDGRTWTELPPPPHTGWMVESPSGLLVNYVLDPNRCSKERNDASNQFDNEQTPESAKSLDDAFWTCASTLKTMRLNPQSNEWELIDAGGPGPTPSLTPISRVGNTLVTPILEPGKALTVWTASLSATDWTSDPNTTLKFIDDTGSPVTVAVAAADDIVVIATPDRVVDGETVLLVGTLS